jgi:hypothetical protein
LIRLPSLPVFVSYFTPDTPYELRARRLVKSLSRHGLDFIVEPRPARSSWVENCAQKALFVRDIWHRVERPVCWVDADAVLLRRPLELDGLSEDFAVVKRDGWSFYGGQIYFGKSEAARALIDRWCAYCQHCPSIWDQVSLGYAWWDMELEKGINAGWLDEGLFVKAQDNFFKTQFLKWRTGAAFLHHQQSRRGRRAKAPDHSQPQREFKSTDLPPWWCAACAAGAPFPLSASQIAELGLAGANLTATAVAGISTLL